MHIWNVHSKLFIAALLTILFLIGGTADFASAQTSDAPAAEEQFDDDADFEDFEDFDDEYSDEPLVADPLYAFNYAMFQFNDFLYYGVAKPVATAYDWAVPTVPRRMISNFFTNLLYPVRFVNNLLQGKWDAAYMETSKFIMNTTWGVLGLMDVTSTMKRRWEPERPTAEGFGQSMGKAGIGHGFYIVWPVVGPSSLRESIGWYADAQLDPLSYGKFTLIEFAAIRSFKNLNTLSLELVGNEYEAMTTGAIDPYAAVKNAYIRFRAKKVEE